MCMEIKINFLIHEHFMVDFEQPQGGRSTGQHIYQQIKLYSEIHTRDTPKLQEERKECRNEYNFVSDLSSRQEKAITLLKKVI